MKDPTTLEEALIVINDLRQKNKDVIDEKKKVLEMFDKDTLDGMTDTEKKLAEALENTRQENAKLAKQIEDDKIARENEAKDVLTKKIDERIKKVAKGDADFEAKLRANVDLLDKLPKSTDEELDAVIDKAYTLTGQKEANPLNNGGFANQGNNNGAGINYAETNAGKAMADKLGLGIEADAGAGGNQ